MGNSQADAGSDEGEPSDSDVVQTPRRAHGREEVPSHEVEVVADPHDLEPEEGDPDLAHVQAVIRGLRGAGPIQIWRKKPTWCQGYLTTIEVGRGEQLDLRQLKADWGGGELQFRPQTLTDRGIRFARGGGTIRFTGPPREFGREITPDGYVNRAPAPAAAIERVPAVRPVGLDPSTQMMMLMFQELMGVLRRPAPRAEVERDPLGDAEKLLMRLHRMQGLLGGHEDEDEDEEPAKSSIEEKVLEVLLKKFDRDGEKKKESPAAASGGARWRLHKAKGGTAATPAGPATAAAAAPAKLAPKQLLELIQKLSPEEQMELLGTASQRIDPDLIREWMAAGGLGEAVGS